MDFKTELLKVVLPIVASMLGIVGTLALRKLANWADEKAKDSALTRALAVLPHLADAVWEEVSADLKAEIEADAADGQISAEELAQLKVDAVASLKASLKKHGLDALKEAFGPLLEGVLAKVVGTAADAASAKAAAQPAAASAASPK